MAVASNPLETFIWGAGGQKMSPEQVARQREIAAALMQGGMDYSPVDHWLQGAARASQGLVGGLKERWAGEAEQRGREGFQSQWDSVFGGGGGSASPVAAALAETTPALDAANQMAGAPVTDWLEYANQGATRNQPLAPELVNAMSFLPEMGVTMRVVSGGQEASGPNRVGSTRHDHGNAGDVDFYQNGRKLDWNNEADLPILSNIVSRARANGVTGIGAGDDYMGAGRFHIGFGNEAVWGAGGKSENAPDWLRAAYSGAPAPARTQVAQVAQAGGGNPSVAQLLSLAGNEWANPGQSSVVSALLGQAMQQQDPAYQQQMALRDLQIRQAEAEYNALMNPAAPAPDFDFMFGPNGELVRTDATSGGIESLGSFAKPNDPGFSQLSQEQIAINGLDPTKAWQQGPDGRIYEVGGSGVNVTTNVLPEVAPNMFADLSKKQTEGYAAMLEQGNIASRTLSQLDQLDELLLNSPNGFEAAVTSFAGNFGIDLGNATGVQAVEALISQLVPAQRPPGSGPMSDADLDLFKRSLPRIINQPGGNALIMQTMRDMAMYDISLSRIISDATRRGAVASPEDAAKIQQEMQDQINALQNPMESFSDRISGYRRNDENSAGQSQIPTLTQEEYNAAPSGTLFKAPDGSIRKKP